MAKSDDHELLFTYFNELNIVSQLSTGLFERNLVEGLTSSQFSVLNWFIRVDDVATPGRLATAFQVTRGAMTNTLKKLVGKGFISVEPDATSGRRKIVKLTLEGRKARDEAMKSVYPLLDEFSKAFDLDEIKQQIAAIERIRRYLDDYRYSNP
jgi:DNA-binding MarR family transcriptional regulator